MSLSTVRTPVSEMGRLRHGDYIEVWRGEFLHNRGPIIDLAFPHGVFWILDELTGTRKIIDLDESQVWTIGNGSSTTCTL